MKSKAGSTRTNHLRKHKSGPRLKNVGKFDATNFPPYTFADALINAIHVPLLILDQELTIQAANSAFFQIFQVTPEGTLQRNIVNLGTHNSQMQELIKKLKKLNNKATSFKEFELTYQFTKIGERIMLVNAKRIMITQKNSEFILLTIEDVTQRKLLEQQKDDFVGYVTHELKTPLTSLSAFIQILQGYHNKTGDKKSQFLVAKIASQMERLTNLLSSFSHVYQAQSNKLELTKTVFRLADLVTEEVELFQYTTTTHTITIEGKLTKSIKADKERIRQVLANLLINAIKYSPAADKIIVKLQETTKAVIVSVQDFGMGIPHMQQAHIFERFFRVKTKEKYYTKGLGLGLYLVREIMKAHGGKVWVESTEGLGATFSFSLPVK